MPTTASKIPRTISTKEGCTLLHVARPTFARWCRANGVRWISFGSKQNSTVRWFEEDVLALLAKSTVDPNRTPGPGPSRPGLGN
jgi:hypothetical protein